MFSISSIYWCLVICASFVFVCDHNHIPFLALFKQIYWSSYIVIWDVKLALNFQGCGDYGFLLAIKIHWANLQGSVV
jgi:hypothetical protein